MSTRDQHQTEEAESGTPRPEDNGERPEVPYLDLYGEPRAAWITDHDYDPADLWEGTDYAAVDTRSELSIVLHWDERHGWFQR